MFLSKLLIILSVLYLTSVKGYSGELPELEEILVLSPRIDRSLDVTGAETTILTRKDLESMHIRSIPELLESIAGINLIERGTPGSQAEAQPTPEPPARTGSDVHAVCPQTGQRCPFVRYRGCLPS